MTDSRSRPRFKMLGARPERRPGRAATWAWWAFYAAAGAWVQLARYLVREAAMKSRKGASVGAVLAGALTVAAHLVRAPHGGDRRERFWFSARSRVFSPQALRYWRAGLRAAKTPYPDYEVRERVRRRDDHACRVCGAAGGPHGDAELHVDHVVPRKWGGPNDPANLRTLCRRCHGVRHLRAFRD